MIYLDTFEMLDTDVPYECTKRTCYNTYYPFQVFYNRDMPRLEFDDITIFYGSNGCGKSTLLNVIAEKLQVERDSVFNRSNFYQQYVDGCEYTLMPACEGKVPGQSRIITSDDVFDYVLDVRCLNQNIDNRREELLQEYLDLKYSKFTFYSLDDLDELRKSNMAKKGTQSNYVRKNVMDNVREKSNGESAFMYFTSKIQDHALYLLDEPENSLSSRLQMELRQFIIDSMRGFKCQFIIASHSPFILSIPGARIYDLDMEPPCVRKWTELETMQDYYKLFMEYRDDFERKDG